MHHHNFSKKSLALHKKHRGKITVAIKTPLRTKTDLNIIYTPGVGTVAKAIAKHKHLIKTYTNKQNTVAIISDGSAVLGIGNVGPEASLPVLEGKAVIFKTFANIDAIPIILNTQDPEEIIKTIIAIAPTFGAIQLEDISAPRCFEIEKRLQKNLPMPVMHDDQHGTAVVVLAGLINALKVVRKNKSVHIIISGAGAAGLAITKLLHAYGFKNITLLDSYGVISKLRSNLNYYKKEVLPYLKLKGTVLKDAIEKTDVFIGVSAPNIVTEEMVRSMNKDAIIFAMANPIPEIMPDRARHARAKIVATGRSDFPNQINNALAYPGIFRGLLDYHVPKITRELEIKVAEALAALIKNPTPTKIIPDIFDKRIVPTIKNVFQIL